MQRRRRIELWASPSEILKTLWVWGLMLACVVSVGLLLKVPEPPPLGTGEISWGWFSILVAVAVAVALLARMWVGWAGVVAGAVIVAVLALLAPRLLPFAAALWITVAAVVTCGIVALVTWRSERFGHLQSVAFALLIGASILGAAACLAATDLEGHEILYASVVIIAVASMLLGLFWVGATALVAGAAAISLVVLLVLDVDWLSDPEHLRIASLVTVGLIVVTLVFVSLEFSRGTMRLLTLVALVGIVALTMQLGRVQARQQQLVDARKLATELDVELSNLVRSEVVNPAAATGVVARAERALLQGALVLAEDDPVRRRLLVPDEEGSSAWIDVLTERHIAPLRALATTTAQLAVVEQAERVAAAKRQALITGPPSRLMVASQGHIERLCNAAEGRLVSVLEPGDVGGQQASAAPQACEGGHRQSDGDLRHAGDTAGIAQQGADAAWSVERLRHEVAGADGDAIGEAGHDAVFARLSAAPDGTPVDLLTAGGEAMLRGLPGMNDDAVPAAVTTVAWIVLAALVLLGYRWLEILNGRAEPGPVTMQPDDHATEIDRQRLNDLRRHIVRNIDEPGAVPGADTLQPVSDVLEATGDEQGKIVAALLRLVGVVFPKTGYTVEAIFSVTDGPLHADAVEIISSPGAANAGGNGVAAGPQGPSAHPAPGQELSVTVVLKDARNGRTKRVIVTTDGSESTAIREAGYRAAAWVLSQSSRVPSWGRWDETTAKSLCRYTEAADSGDAGIEKLNDAVRNAPTSGLLLALLAHRCDLDGQHHRAAEHSLRAVALHPRYPVARDRAGISFSLLAARDAEAWDECRDKHSHVRTNLEAAGRAIGIRRWSSWEERADGCPDGGRPTHPAWWQLSGEAAVLPLCRVGDDLLRSNRHALARHSVLHHAFRRSERRYWLSLVLRTRANAAGSGFGYDVLRAVNDSARLALMERGSANPERGSNARWPSDCDRQRIKQLARTRSRLTWQIDYNLACASAIHAARNPNSASSSEENGVWRQFAARLRTIITAWPRAIAARLRTIAVSHPCEPAPQLPNEEKAMRHLEQLLLRPKVEQLSRDWAAVDPDLEALRSGALLRRFEHFLDHLPPSKGEAWQSRVRAYAEEAPSTSLFRVRAVDGAESLVVHGDDVELRDLRRTGVVSRDCWDRRARSPLGRLPQAVRWAVDGILAAEIGEALRLLPEGQPLDYAGPATVQRAARQFSQAVAVLLLPASSGLAERPMPPDVAVVELPPGAAVPGTSLHQMPADGWLVIADRPPLVRHVTERLRFSYSLGATQVRFVVHERVGLTLDRDANVKIIRLFLPDGRESAARIASSSG